MTDRTPSPQDAAEWFLVVYSTIEPSAETLQAWLKWMEASDENRRAFEDTVQIWHNTPAAVIARSAAAHDAQEEPDYDGSLPIAEWRAIQSAQTANTVPAMQSLTARRWRRPLLAVAAGAIVCAVGLASYRHFAAVSHGEFATSTAEVRQLALADGSTITLGGHSRLAVDFEPTKREVRLEDGEAYFNVHRDPTRPFVVLARGGAITAIGTAFNVRAVEDRVTVTVTEGSVAVTDAGATLSHSIVGMSPALEAKQLAPGEQLTYSRAKKAAALEATSIKHVDIGETARWREGWLIYRDETLKYVVADIARYTDIRVTVADAAADVQFSGAVSQDHIAEWLAALPDVTPVSVKRTEQGFTIATR